MYVYWYNTVIIVSLIVKQNYKISLKGWLYIAKGPTKNLFQTYLV